MGPDAMILVVWMLSLSQLYLEWIIKLNWIKLYFGGNDFPLTHLHCDSGAAHPSVANMKAPCAFTLPIVHVFGEL